MTRITCFSTLFAKKNRSKESSKAVALINGNGDFRVNPEEQLVDPCVHKDHNVVLEDIFMENTVLSIIEERNSQNTEGAGDDKDEGAYEGGDEHDEILSLKGNFSDFDLQAFGAHKDQMSSRHDDDVSQSNEVDGEDNTPQAGINNGHISDPELGQRSMFWGSPILKRSCSNIETKRDRRLITSPTKSYYSSDNAHDIWATLDGEATNGLPGSPVSVMASSFSADRVMRKKSYSFPVLPSMNRKLCWKLFLSSHKNFHGPWISIQQRININDVSKKTAGYCSDVPGSSPCVGTRDKQKMEQPETMTQADLWVQCYAETSAVDKVNAWIHGLEDCQFVDDGNGAEEAAEEAFSYPTSFEVGETSRKKKSQTGQPTKEIIQGNNVFQALCSFSPVANLAGMGLKVIPAISAFSSLRSVNLSGNLIAYISSGMLPRSLHTLDLSRNQIATVDGLRELTRLRVLNLSYNKISRISYGLLNCTPMKELYLAGNKISNIEGLHRLLKLKVLDLSFNKITTAKTLGQLVANHNSLLALNLLGNPIQSNVSEEQLRRSICSILPKLVYLNKKRFKPQKGREVDVDDIAKVALGGNEHWSSRKRLTRRVTQLPTSSSSGKSSGRSNSHRSKGRCQQPNS